MQMETKMEEIRIDETDYTSNLHNGFYLYSPLLGHIDFQNCFSFPAPIYAYPLGTTTLVHALTADELLECLMLLSRPEPSDEELLEMLISDLNITKLPATVATLSLTSRPAAADLTVLATLINDFLKLTLDDISSLAPVPMEMTIPPPNSNGYRSQRYTATSDL
uniref:Uncharacterized protein n=1 Tax=Romanomermis culicivorax TaxID=13658 RepID=A0A915JKG4_ROMCU